MRQFHQVISMAFPKPVDWNRIQACTQKSDDPIHDYYNQLQIVLKENSTLLSDVDSTWVSINPMFINGLNWVLSFLVKRTRIEWGTMSTPYLAHLASQLTQTLDGSPKRKTTIFKPPTKDSKQNQNPPSFCYYREEPGHSKETATNVLLSTSDAFNPLTSLSNICPILNDRTLRNNRGSSQSPLSVSSLNTAQLVGFLTSLKRFLSLNLFPFT